MHPSHAYTFEYDSENEVAYLKILPLAEPVSVLTALLTERTHADIATGGALVGFEWFDEAARQAASFLSLPEAAPGPMTGDAWRLVWLSDRQLVRIETDSPLQQVALLSEVEIEKDITLRRVHGGGLLGVEVRAEPAARLLGAISRVLGSS